MHELSIMQSAFGSGTRKGPAGRGQPGACIRLRIGALSGVVPDALQFAFEALADGTRRKVPNCSSRMSRRGSGAPRAIMN